MDFAFANFADLVANAGVLVGGFARRIYTTLAYVCFCDAGELAMHICFHPGPVFL